MAKQQDQRENIKEIRTIEKVAADGVKKSAATTRVRKPRGKNPLVEEEAIKADETHAD